MNAAELNELAARYAEFRRMGKGLPDSWLEYINGKTPATQRKFWATVDKLDREFFAKF